MRRWLLRLILIGGLAWGVVLIIRRRSVAAEPALRPVWPAFDDADPALASTAPPAPVIAEDVPPSERWHDPVDRACPKGYDVKVKLASGIYHLPGMFAYDRTIPDRCYTSPEAAEADGFRAAKR
jgi:hypothetical protein